jgi:hypothetical protein
MTEEGDGLHSFHKAASYVGQDYESINIRRILIDSLGNKHDVEINLQQGGSTNPYFQIVSASSSAYPKIGAYAMYYSGMFYGGIMGGTGLSVAVDDPAKRVVITCTDTGAQLTFDFSDVQGTLEGEHPVPNSEATFFWTCPPIVFRDGIYEIQQERRITPSFLTERWTLSLTIRRSEDGSFTGKLDGSGFIADLRFDEEGRISGYKFTRNAGSTSDSSVEIEDTGSIVKGIYPGERTKGFINVDLSSVQVICIPGSLEPEEIPEEPEEVIPEESPEEEEIPAEPLEEEVSKEAKAGFAPLSSASLSIDENGVLKRLKDNGDWEPVYLLACGQFAAMNAAEERNGIYYATPASGALRTGISGKDGMGTIASGTLERSTTDLAHELSEMIRAQHAYAANTKVLSTLDDMLTELERL